MNVTVRGIPFDFEGSPLAFRPLNFTNFLPAAALRSCPSNFAAIARRMRRDGLASHANTDDPASPPLAPSIRENRPPGGTGRRSRAAIPSTPPLEFPSDQKPGAHCRKSLRACPRAIADRSIRAVPGSGCYLGLISTPRCLSAVSSSMRSTFSGLITAFNCPFLKLTVARSTPGRR